MPRRPWSAWAERLRRTFTGLVAALPLAAGAADPQIASFIDSPDPVAAGGLYTYTVRVDNNTVDAAANVRLRLVVPAGASFVSAAPAGANCVLQGGSPPTVLCTLGSVGPLGNDPRDVSFTWRATGPGPAVITATATVLADNDTNPDPANNTQNATTSVVAGANLSLAKTGAPDPVIGGANVTYTLTVGNAGPNDTGDLVVTDNLPPSVSYVSGGGNGWGCSHAAGVVTCTRAGPHALAGAIPALTIVGKVNAASGSVTNSASVAPAAGVAGVADPDPSNNAATATTTVQPGADVRIAGKTVTSSLPAVAGSNVSFQIQPRNDGPAAASNVTVSDVLPAGWSFVSASGPNWSCSQAAGTVSCTRAAMPVGATDNITVVAQAPGNAAVGATGTSYTNTATIAAATSDPNAGNNSGSVNVNVLPDGADLRLAKTKTPNPVALNSDMTSTITVTNNGPRSATGPLRVVEQLSGESYQSASGSGWSCAETAPGSGTVVCDHANAGGLALDASLPMLTLVTRATAAGAAVNTACTGASVPAGVLATLARPPAEGDPNATNDCAARSANSTAVRPDLAITKTTSTPAGGDKVVSSAESSVTYTLVVANVSAGAENATGVRIDDTVPGWITGRSSFGAVTATPSGGSTATFGCSTGAAGGVSCVQTGGVLAQGQSVTVSITVNRPLLDGSHTNTASVTNTAEGDPNAANNSASDTVVIDPIADIEMTGKTVTPASVRAGEQATYVLSYRNNGPSPAAGVTLADSFALAAGDSGLTVVSITSSKGGSSCSVAAGAVLTPASPGFNCTIGALANGETQSVTLVVRPNWQPGNAARSFGNTARVDTTTVENPAGGDNGNNTRNATLAVTAAAVDLLVNKTDRVGAVNLDPVPYDGAGTYLAYQVGVTNSGPSYATGVKVTENMVPPAGRRVRFVCDVTAFGGNVCNAVPLCSVSNVTSAPGAAIPAFTCSVPAGNAATGTAVGELAVGASKNLFLRFEVLDQPQSAGDVYSNTVTSGANEPDTQPGNDSATETTTTRQRIDLRTTKSASVASPTLMQPFNWTVTVVNNGPGNSLQTDLTDTLPAGLEVTGAITWTRTLQPGSGNCSRVGVTVSCALGQLDAGGSATITVPVRFTGWPAGGTATNTATVDTDPNKTGGIDTPGGNHTANNTVNVTRSSLAGTVFEDRDRAGANGGTPQAAAGEPRVAGVTIALTGTDAYGNAVNRNAVTDASGNYVFDNLPPSDATGYTITETQPAGYVNGPVAPPAAGGTAPSAGGNYAAGGAAGNSSYAAVVLATATSGVNYNFPEVRRPSLSGFVYVDANYSGAREAGTDLAVANATVRLLDANTLAVLATTTTDASGAYGFIGLDPLVPYVLDEPLPAAPAGLAQGPVNPGRIGGAACAAGCTAQPDTPAAGTDRIAAIDLSSGADGTLFNFGERQLATIAGLVWVDANRDAVLQPGEAGRVAGVTMRLVTGADCASGTTLQTTATAADGSYAFGGVEAYRNYLVCQTQPAGYGTGSANGVAGSNVVTINNLAAGGSAGNDFGETLASIAGSVYADTGAGVPAHFDNGVREAGEAGIPNVPVTLSGTDQFGSAVSLTVLTDASGNYRFDNLFPPNAAGYTLTEGAIPPASGGFLDGREAAGSAGGSTAVNDVVSGIALTAGQQASGYLFGELPIASITGTVYLDRNGSGTLDPQPTDGRIAGVTLALHQGAGCAGPLVATTTDASGNYGFVTVSVGGTYTVCEAQPAGYAEGSVNPGGGGVLNGANAITITNLAAGGSSGNDFGERAGSIAGSVYLDADNDGARGGAESGIAGVAFTLSGTDANGAAVNRSTVSDASGNWRFDDLLAAGPGGYTVTEQAAQPVVGGVATLNGRTTAGSTGSATPVATVPSAVGAIALAAGASSINHLFGEVLPVAVSGKVFLDLENNGVQNAPGDVGLAGVQIVVSGSDDTGAAVTRSVVTAADGSYAVTDLRPGTYTVTEPVQPAGTTNGQTLAGAAGGTATAQAVTPSAIAGIVLTTPGASAPNNNFAEVPAAGEIKGRVWLDADNNGTPDATEAGIAGVTIELSGTDTAGRAVTRSAVTDAQGRYSFGELPPGTHTVREPAQPAGTVNGRTVAGPLGGSATAPAVVPSAIAGIVLGVNQTAAANDFGEVPAAAIAGRVWADNDDNGVIDANETGLAGVTIVLSGTDDLGNAVNLTLATGADGSYEFNGLRPGNYALTEPQQPAGTVNGRTVAGSTGGNATAPGTLPSAVAAIVLAPGAHSTANNFGELAQSPDLRVSKAALATPWTATKTGTYRISVRNAGELATSGVYTVSDRLPAGLTLAAAPSGNGWACSGAAGAGSFSCTASAAIAAGAAAADAITAVVDVGAAAANASPVDNAVMVEGGGEIAARAPSAAERAAFNGNAAALPLCSAAIEHNACRVPTAVQLAASVSGTVWFDGGSAPRVLDGGDRRLAGWGVEIVDPASGAVLARTTSANDGSYAVHDLVPGVPLAVRFRDPGSGAVFGYPVNGETAPGSSGASCNANAPAGQASSCVGGGASPWLSVVLAPGQNLPQQSLPVDPSGVVYDSGLRQPVPGAVVSLEPTGVCTGWSPATQIVGAGLGGYTVAGNRIAMTVGSDGYYQFLLAPSAPASCSFALTVAPPAGYRFQSTAIVPATGPLVPPGGTGSVYAVQPQAAAPSAAVGPATTYYLTLTTGSAGANIVHNHIPLDPELPSALALSKVGDKSVAEVGDSVRYTITVAVASGPRPRQTTVVDRLPAGFTYIRGTASVNDTPIADPAGGLGRTLAFNLGPMPASGQLVLKYRVRVDVGAMQGDGINHARGHACGVPAGCVGADFAPFAGSVATNDAAFRVRVGGGVFGTDACVAGKIFVDCNGNHLQDREELGIPGVRLVFSDGTTLVSDSEGKYSVCGLPPKSHVLKVDALTLPRGSRLATSSNRNLGDAASLWLDLKNGELHRADFIEGSCSNTVLEQVKARRAQGEVRAPEPEKKGGPALRFDSKAHGLTPQSSPAQGSDGANQRVPKPRAPQAPPDGPVNDESNVPTPALPMNNPAPRGRASNQGDGDGAR